MTNKKILAILSVLIFCQISFSRAFAKEYTLEGDFGVTGRLVNVNGNEAKFNEYGDIRDGFYSGGYLNYDSEDYFLDLKASDIAYDTQHYRLDAGKWGSIKYFFDFREIPHNYTFDAKTFYSGAGTDNLRGTPNTNVKSWSSFDYAVDRKEYGTGFKLDMLRPFFIDISASREDLDGTRRRAAEGGIGFGNTAEIPEPVDFTTNTVKLEGSYAEKPIYASLGFIYSAFSNENELLHFNNAFIPGNPKDTLTLPPDNDYYKVYVKNTVKLPLNSKLNSNLAFSQTTCDVNLLKTYYGNGALQTISLSQPEFDGKIDNFDYDFYLTSNPVSFLDSRIFFRYHKRDNRSDNVITEDAGEIMSSRLIDIRKESYGLELGFRLPARVHLEAAYQRVNTKRNREDVTENRDDVYSIDVRWSGTDFMLLRAGYERLHRGADFHPPDVPTDDPEYMQTFVRRFDVAPENTNIYKVSADFYPMDHFNCSIEYRNRKTDYTETILGLRKANSHEFSIDANYVLKKLLKISAYFDYELTKYFQFQRELPFIATSGFNPKTPPTESEFNWTAGQRDKSFDYGFGADIYAIAKKLTFRLQHDYVRSNGSIDYTYLLDGNPLPDDQTQNNIDISNWDDYRLRRYLVKAIYQVGKKISVSAGYVYEAFHYSDALLDGYRYTIGTPVNTYLTGAYKEPSYSTNIFFVSAVYRF